VSAEQESPALRGAHAVVGLLILGAAAWLSLGAARPPEPLPADAPAVLFSAQRAVAHVERLAATSRPSGTMRHAAAREEILAQLAELGLRPQVQRTTVALQAPGRRVRAAAVANVVARLPGRESGPAVLLMAHYDSRPTAPGAADDAAGVAAVLETVRALRARPVARRDVIVLLTDGEEAGLMGARAFVAEHPWRRDVGVVINLEARGQRGPAIMFETIGPADAPLIAALAASGARPLANSLTSEVYRRLPNDTDLTIFARAQVPGFNLAFIGGLPAYHTALDRPAGLSRRSLQQIGDSALALAAQLAEQPLEAGAGGHEVYFNPLGTHLLTYPRGLALPLALVAVALWLVASLAVHRSGDGGLGSLLGGAALSLAAGLVLALVAQAGWWLLAHLVPGLVRGPYGIPYDGGPIALGLLLAAAAAALWVLGRGMGARSPLALLPGLLVPWVLGALATGLLWPGASFLFAWPLLSAALCTLLGAWWRGGPARLAWLLTLGALPAVILFGPLLALLRDALTVHAMATLGVMTLFPVLLAAPLLAPLVRRWRGLPGFLLLFALALLAYLAIDDLRSAQRPAVDTLAYRLDADRGEAHWLSFDRRPDAWTASVLGATPERVRAPFPVAGGTVLRAPAPAVALAPPRIQPIAVEPGLLRVRLVSPRRAPAAWIEARPATAADEIHAVWVGDQRFEPGGDAGAPARIRITSLPATGLVLGFEHSGALALRVADQSYKLPTDAGLEARSPERIAVPAWLTDSSLVVVEQRFDAQDMATEKEREE